MHVEALKPFAGCIMWWTIRFSHGILINLWWLSVIPCLWFLAFYDLHSGIETFLSEGFSVHCPEAGSYFYKVFQLPDFSNKRLNDACIIKQIRWDGGDDVLLTLFFKWFWIDTFSSFSQSCFVICFSSLLNVF